MDKIQDILKTKHETLKDSDIYNEVKDDEALLILSYIFSNYKDPLAELSYLKSEMDKKILKSIQDYGLIGGSLKDSKSTIMYLELEDDSSESINKGLEELNSSIINSKNNVVLIKFLNNNDLFNYSLSKETYIAFQSYVKNKKWEKCIKIYSYDLEVCYSEKSYIRLTKVFTHPHFEESVLKLIKLGRYNEALESIEERSVFFVDKYEVEEMGRGNLLPLAYIAFKKKLKISFENYSEELLYIRYCHFLFNGYYLQKIDQLKMKLSMNNDVLVYNQGTEESSIIAKVKYDKNIFRVNALPITEIINEFSTETVIISHEPEEFKIEIESMQSIYTALDGLLKLYKFKINQSTDARIQFKLKEGSTYTNDGIYFKDMIERLLEVARRKIKKSLVSAKDFILFIKDKQLYFSIIEEESELISLKFLDLENETELFDNMNIENLLPTYLFEEWDNINLPETKINIIDLEDRELDSLKNRFEDTSFSYFNSLIKEGRYREALFFFSESYDKKEKEVYSYAIKRNPDLDKFIITDFNGKILSIFDTNETT